MTSLRMPPVVVAHYVEPLTISNPIKAFVVQINGLTVRE
jgi:hypothetical protein